MGVCHHGLLVVDHLTTKTMKTKILKAIAKGVILGASMIAVAALSGCTLTVSPDGSRTYSSDSGAFLRAIEVIAEK